MKTATWFCANAVMVGALCFGSISAGSAADPAGGRLSPPGRAAGGPRVPEPQNRVEPTVVGPVEPIPKRVLTGRSIAHQKPDLLVEGLGFTSVAKVRYLVLNLSDTAASQPFVVDIYVDGQRRDTVKHGGLPPLSQQRVESSMATPGGCGQTQLRVLADSQQVVAEANESNNMMVRTQVPPCPDLVVRIEQTAVGNNKYKAVVVVTNKGSRTTGRPFMVFVRELNVPVGTIPAPPTDKRIDELPAGKSASFSYGNEHFWATAVDYEAIVDRFDDIKESDESNNHAKRKLPKL